jgi:hypothetical protein
VPALQPFDRPKRAVVRASLSLLLGVGLAFAARSAEELRNWFNDPFFQISASVPDCPLPLGPLMSESEKRVQAHHRAEKGTTCWLAKQCDRPNAYAYDQDIADSFRKAVAGGDGLRGTTLWATVQGRVLYIEGCALDDSAAARVEAMARALPYVQQAIAIVRTDPKSAPPYKVRQP